MPPTRRPVLFIFGSLPSHEVGWRQAFFWNLANHHTSEGNSLRVIVDTDIGDDVDDVLALAFALRRPELDVVGITTVLGGVEGRCRIVAKLLSVLGKEEISVAAGRTLPLDPERANRKRLEGTPFQGACAADVPDRDWPDAIDTILETTAAHPGDVGLITLGPLTNIGAALQADPDLGKRVRFIASMAASAEPERKEYNAAADPEAADLVFRSGAPLVIGTWETTRKVVLYSEEQSRIAESHSPLAQFLAENMELWRPVQGNKPGPVMYDLAPIVWAFRPELYPTRAQRITMALAEPERGRTPITSEAPPNAEVCVDVNTDEVLELYLETVLAE